MKTLAPIALRFGRGFAVSILLALSAKAAQAQPVPHFSYGPPAPNAGTIVSFFGSAEGSVTSWSWNFGDGFTSTAQSPTHPFSSTGQKNVTLRTTNASGSLSVTTSILVGGGKQNSIPDYSYSPLAPVANQTVAFTDASQFAASYSWSFGDGGSSTAPSPTHKFTAQGTYTVTLTTVSSDGISNDSTRSITVSPGATGPTANFTFFPANPNPGQTVSFTDTSTGSPTSWGWNFGDGSPVSNAQNPTHVFASTNTYNVTLTASNANGSSQITRSVSVGLAPVASFTFSPSSVTVGQSVTFADTSTNSPTTWLWNFGDGSPVWTSQTPPPHPYGAAGSYTVMLTVSNAFGSNSTTRTVPVTSSFSASFNFSPSSPLPGQTVSFSDTSTGGPTSWSWNFGDGSTSAQRNPIHAFATAGNYSVTLTASNATSSNSVTQTVRVGTLPPCAANTTTLCLNGGRFQVRVAWTVPDQGTSGVGTAVPQTSDTGAFWFFSSNNLELLIKVVDGRAVNNRFWVFYGALSDVQYTVTVTDTLTGAVKTYSNPYHRLSSVADTGAFSPTRAAPHGEGEARSEFVIDPMDNFGMPQASPIGEEALAACTPSATALCLNGSRFQVNVSWSVPSQGTSGVGTAIGLTSDTGTFWFFSSNNLELVLKVVDGRAVNNHFWVFYGALSDVQYTITVRDTVGGTVKTYTNPSGNLASVADVLAF